MKKPIIGIVGRPGKIDEVTSMTVCEKYRLAVVNSGGIPFLILPNQYFDFENERPRNASRLTDDEKKSMIKILDMCDGILLPGGSKWFEIDEFICRYALDNDIPLLGICLGMQLMVCTDNKSVNDGCDCSIVNNDTRINHKQPANQYVHKLMVEPNTYLNKIYGRKEFSVNSRHNYHVSSTNNLIVSAYSEDGIIEAVEKPGNKFAIGVQWHPESMVSYDSLHKKLFDEFIKKASE